MVRLDVLERAPAQKGSARTAVVAIFLFAEEQRALRAVARRLGDRGGLVRAAIEALVIRVEPVAVVSRRRSADNFARHHVANSLVAKVVREARFEVGRQENFRS